MTTSYFEPPKELYDKFDEFLGLLFELHLMRDNLYELFGNRVEATLETMKEEGGFGIKTPETKTWVSLRFDEDDNHKILARSITVTHWSDPVKAAEVSIEILSSFCDELRAAKEPEPEVLITKITPHGNEYKISKEWMNWFRKALPRFPPEAAYENGGLRAAKKYFQTGSHDRIERVPELLLNSAWYGAVDKDLEIEFYRVTRVKL